jgi:hypothetical protein
LALELERRGIDTVVLEGGGEGYDAQTQDLHGGECIGEHRFDIRSTRLRQLGGTTQHWGGMSPRMVAGDLERREGGFLSVVGPSRMLNSVAGTRLPRNTARLVSVIGRKRRRKTMYPELRRSLPVGHFEQS